MSGLSGFAGSKYILSINTFLVHQSIVMLSIVVPCIIFHEYHLLIIQWQKIGGWILAVITGHCVVYASIWAGPGTPQIASVFYNTFTRPAFAMAVAWVAFACMMGYGGR